MDSLNNLTLTGPEISYGLGVMSPYIYNQRILLWMEFIKSIETNPISNTDIDISIVIAEYRLQV